MLAMTSTVFMHLYGKIIGCKNIIKLTKYQRKKLSQGMVCEEIYRAAIRGRVISFKDNKYEVWVRSLPQDLVGTPGYNSVNKGCFI